MSDYVNFAKYRIYQATGQHAALAAGGEFTATMNYVAPLPRIFSIGSMLPFVSVGAVAEANVIYVVEFDMNTTTQTALGVKVRNIGTAGGTQTIRLTGFVLDMGDLIP